MQDRRLEAIAGPPVMRGSAPARTTLALGSMIIAVGLWVFDPAAVHQRLFSAAGSSVGVMNDGETWYRAGVSQFGRTGSVFYAYGTTTAVAAVGLGTSQSGIPGYDWTGPFRAVAYDRALTDAQAMAVVRHLAAQLIPLT